MNNDKDRRRAPRFEADGKVKLTMMETGITVSGRLKDISMNGIFVLLSKKPDKKWGSSGCRFILKPEINNKTYTIHGEAHITRVTDMGLGLFISTIEPASRQLFVRVMVQVSAELRRKLQ